MGRGAATVPRQRAGGVAPMGAAGPSICSFRHAPQAQGARTAVGFPTPVRHACGRVHTIAAEMLRATAPPPSPTHSRTFSPVCTHSELPHARQAAARRGSNPLLSFAGDTHGVARCSCKDASRALCAWRDRYKVNPRTLTTVTGKVGEAHGGRLDGVDVTKLQCNDLLETLK